MHRSSHPDTADDEPRPMERVPGMLVAAYTWLRRGAVCLIGPSCAVGTMGKAGDEQG